MDILKSIQHLLPGAQLAIVGNEYDSITWYDDRPQPTLEELEAIQTELEAIVPKDWDLLVQRFLGSQIYMKSFYLSKDSLPIAQSFNKLEQVVLITRIEPALAFFLQDLREELGANVTTGEIQEVNQLLVECGFGGIQLDEGATNG